MVKFRVSAAAAYAIACVMLLATPAQAADDLLYANNPAAVAAAVQEAGYAAKLTTDKVGDPKIETKMSGWTMGIFFYGCKESADCSEIQFSAGFDVPSGIDERLLLDWAQNNRYGSVYLDSENDPIIQWDVTMVGGLTKANFADVLASFDAAVGNFGNYVFANDRE
jgi:hypothetical protein